MLSKPRSASRSSLNSGDEADTPRQLYIFDLNKPATPIPPGPPSTKLGEITSLQWNPTVPRIFAASSSSGYTSVWDLKVQKEIASLQYGGGAAKGMDNVGGQMGLQMGKRRGMSDVCWHPEQVSHAFSRKDIADRSRPCDWSLRRKTTSHRSSCSGICGTPGLLSGCVDSGGHLNQADNGTDTKRTYQRRPLTIMVSSRSRPAVVMWER